MYHVSNDHWALTGKDTIKQDFKRGSPRIPCTSAIILLSAKKADLPWPHYVKPETWQLIMVGKSASFLSRSDLISLILIVLINRESLRNIFLVLV